MSEDPAGAPGVARRSLLAAAVLAGGALGAAVLLDPRDLRDRPAEVPPSSPWDPDLRDGPVLGLLQTRPEEYPQVSAAGIGAVTVSVPWSRAEPVRGRVDDEVLDRARRTIGEARDAGLEVALTPGLQYPPDWALDGTRFVDQHGHEWHGGVGDDVADAVFDDRVRAAQEEYVHVLGDRLGDLEPSAVRLGGLARGELHYPFMDREGPRDTMWCYSDAAQERSPVPGARPGEASEDECAALADWYLEELSGYGRWQADLVREAFGSAPHLLVLLPSWGLRPGEVTEAVGTRLDGSTSGQRRGTLTEGLDWQRQLQDLAEVGGLSVVTTWLDTPDQGDDPQLTSPVRYLSGLAGPLGLEVWGENTGDNTADDLRRCLGLVDELDLGGLFWMSARTLGEGSNATLDDYAGAIADRAGADGGTA